MYFIKEMRTYLYTTAVFIIIMTAIFRSFGLFPFGTKTLLTSDMRSQYVDFLSYFKNITLSGYSFKLGAGNDLLSFVAYYLASPINMLVFFFKNSADAASAIFVVKLLLAALSCNFYLKHSEIIAHNGVTEKAVPLLSVMYAFCGFTMMYSMNIIWFDTVYLFPLLILSVENMLLNKGRSMPLWTALIIITGFYTGIMAIYFSLLYCVVLYIIFKDRVSFRRMIHGYFTGISMSAFVLMPVLIRLSSNKMTEDNFMYKLSLLLNKELSDIFGFALQVWFIALVVIYGFGIILIRIKGGQAFMRKNVVNNALFAVFGCMILIVNVFFLIGSFRVDGFSDLKCFLPFKYDKDSPQLYSGIVTYIGVALGVYSLRHGEFKKYIVLLLLLTVSMIPIFSYNFDILIHAGQEPISFPFRYTFIISFYMIIVSAYGFSCYRIKEQFLNIFAVMFTVVFAVEIFVNALGTFKYNETYWFGYTDHKNFERFIEKTGDAVDKIDDDGFYRVEKNFNRNVNDNMQLNYNGISHYSSMYNYGLINFLVKSGCVCTHLYGTYIGHTPLMDALFGVKYTMASTDTDFLEKCTISKDDNFTYYDDMYEKIYSNDCVDLYENPDGDNFAFYADDAVLNMNVDEMDIESFEFLNQVYNSILGSEVNPYNRQTVIENDINIFNIEATESGALFVKTSSNVEHKTVYVNDSPVGSGYYDLFGYVHTNLYCAKVEKGDIVTLRFESPKQISSNDVLAYIEESEAYDEAVRFMQKNKVGYNFKSDDEIIINVSGDGGLIFTRIPYDENWKAVSDKNVLTYNIFNTFLCLEAPAGEYTIVLKYKPSGLLWSSMISIFAFFVFLMGLCKGLFIKKYNKK